MKKFRIFMTTALLATSVISALACSRVVYLGTDNTIMVGRTLDWRTPIPTNLYVYPQGISKKSMESGNFLSWTSRYGSVVAVGYDGGVTEGMNEKGLVMNGLFCKGSVYTEATPDNGLPVMSLSVLVSFFLDNFATVDEVEQWLNSNSFGIRGAGFDGGTVSLLHWAITDASGQSLVMEYNNGKLNTYKGREELAVLTNDPQLPDMNAINAYWQKVGGANALPGTASSPDRFVRASFFINHTPKVSNSIEAFAVIRSIMGTVSVPFGYEIDGEPNISSTQWTSIADISNKRYYFTFADAVGSMWINLNEFNLQANAPILKLDTSNHTTLTGDVSSMLIESPGFNPMW